MILLLCNRIIRSTKVPIWNLLKQYGPQTWLWKSSRGLKAVCFFSGAHTGRDARLFLTVSSCCCLINWVSSDPGWAGQTLGPALAPTASPPPWPLCHWLQLHTTRVTFTLSSIFSIYLSIFLCLFVLYLLSLVSNPEWNRIKLFLGKYKPLLRTTPNISVFYKLPVDLFVEFHECFLYFCP